jgi:hypothetical protein
LFPKRWRESEFDDECASFIRESSAADPLPAVDGDFGTALPSSETAMIRK